MRPLIAGLLCVLLTGVVFLAWRLNSTNAALALVQQQAQTQLAALADKSKQDALALQEKCAAQAEKVFGQLGYKSNLTSENLDNNSLQSHFIQKFNKCFMTIEENRYDSDRVFTSRFLLDAYEQREYGEYIWMSDKVKKYWEVQPIVCKEIPLAG